MTAATSKMELFVIIVNGFQPLTVITNFSNLDVAAVLDPPLDMADITCQDWLIFEGEQLWLVRKNLI